jgi:hypothetical protein
LRDALDERVSAGGAKPRMRGVRAEHGDAADSGAAGHEDVFWRIANVNR